MKPAFRSFSSAIILIAWFWAFLLLPAQTAAQAPEAPPNGNTATTSPNGTQLVSIDFNNVDIGVFIKFISDLTKRNFVVDDKVRGKVTIISPGKITVEEAYQVFESVLEVYGYATVRAGEITKIVPAPDARTKNIKTRLQEESGVANDAVVTQIIPLRYADPNEIKTLFTPLISRSSVIQAYPPTNTLIVTDVNSNIQRMLKILKAIDITGVGQQIALIPVENASAAKLVTMLESIFRSPKGPKGAAQKDLTFVADERTNIIVVLASEGDVDNIRRLVNKLDIETPRGQGNIRVYYLEHANAEDMAKVLQDIPQKSAETNQAGKPVAPVVSSKVRIAADKATNSLIITADPDDYLILESIIKQIDIPRAMVYIEALIMEVNVSKNFRLGTQWLIGEDGSHDDKDFIVGGGFQGDTPLVSTDVTTGVLVPTLANGFSLGLFGEAITIDGISFPSITAVVNAYKRDADTNILSTPQILTTDNQEAKIYVGKNVPFQTTATVTSSTVGEVYNSFEYRDVGKTLKITPQISKDRMVRLVISLEVTALEGTEDFRPTTLKRTVDTTAIVQDGHTVVLGGLIDDATGNSVVKVPCLGDIPGFGYLFRSKSNAFDKSNLYIFLTPRVIQNSEEATKVSTSKRTQIENLREDNINLYERNTDPPPQEDIQIPAPQQGPYEGAMPPRGSLGEPQASDRMVAKPHSPGESGAPVVSQNGAIDGNHQDDRSTAQDSGTHNAADFSALAKTPAGATPDQNASADQDVNAATPRPAAAEGLREQSPKSQEDTGSMKGYTLQVISLQNAAKAGELLDHLTAKGFAAYTVRTEVDGAVWYRIRIGYFSDQKDAAPTIEQLEADQFTPILIKL